MTTRSQEDERWSALLGRETPVDACLSPEDLAAWVEGERDDASTRHLAACDQCREDLLAAHAVSAVAGETPSGADRRAARSPSGRQRLRRTRSGRQRRAGPGGIAGLVFLVFGTVGIGLFALRSSPAPTSETSPDAVPNGDAGVRSPEAVRSPATPATPTPTNTVVTPADATPIETTAPAKGSDEETIAQAPKLEKPIDDEPEALKSPAPETTTPPVADSPTPAPSAAPRESASPAPPRGFAIASLSAVTVRHGAQRVSAPVSLVAGDSVVASSNGGLVALEHATLFLSPSTRLEISEKDITLAKGQVFAEAQGWRLRAHGLSVDVRGGALVHEADEKTIVFAASGRALLEVGGVEVALAASEVTSVSRGKIAIPRAVRVATPAWLVKAASSAGKPVPQIDTPPTEGPQAGPRVGPPPPPPGGPNGGPNGGPDAGGGPGVGPNGGGQGQGGQGQGGGGGGRGR